MGVGSKKERGLCHSCDKTTINGAILCEEHKQLNKLIRIKREQDGLCKQCGRIPPEMGKASCTQCLQQDRIVDKVRRINKNKSKICEKCSNFAKLNCIFCSNCLSKAGVHTKKRRKFYQSQQICVYCTKKPLFPINRSYCDSCLLKILKINDSTERLWELLKLSNNKCMIEFCDHISKRSLHVDHDHKTGKLRGILCDHHNRGLGIFKDNPKCLRSAAEYLEKSKK